MDYNTVQQCSKILETIPSPNETKLAYLRFRTSDLGQGTWCLQLFAVSISWIKMSRHLKSKNYFDKGLDLQIRSNHQEQNKSYWSVFYLDQNPSSMSSSSVAHLRAWDIVPVTLWANNQERRTLAFLVFLYE